VSPTLGGTRVAAVRFGPVRGQIFPNLKPDFGWFTKSPEPEPDAERTGL